MSANRIVLAGAIALLTAFVVTMAIGIAHAGNTSSGGYAGLLILVAVVLVVLIVAGSRLYGASSHYGRAAARNRPAQEAHNRAIDEARAQSVQHQVGADPNGPETETPR
jgi:NADH:ubiquinone oxidoreductase subunit 6 (subunit J)